MCVGASACLGNGGYFLLVHKKAVPAMMGVFQNSHHHGGTANGQRREAGPPATVSHQVIDRIDA